MSTYIPSILVSLELLCPGCHQATLFEHYQEEYKRDWKKCSSCSFMILNTELRIRCLNRIKEAYPDVEV